MLTGYNTDVRHLDRVIHVQTEDRGLSNPKVHSLLYEGGVVLDSQTTPYLDLIVDGVADQVALRERMASQHEAWIKAIEAGRFDEDIESGSGAAVTTAVPLVLPEQRLVVKMATPVVAQTVKEATAPLAIPEKWGKERKKKKKEKGDKSPRTETVTVIEAPQGVEQKAVAERPVHVPMTWALLTRGGFDVGKIFVLKEGVNLIGRDALCNVLVDTESVSRINTKITIDDEVVIVEDLESSNGTFLNGVRLTAREVAAEGATIKIGDLVLKLASGDCGLVDAPSVARIQGAYLENLSQRQPLSVVLCRIEAGESVGLVATVTPMIKSAIRPCDVVASIGGGHFLVGLPGLDEETAGEIAINIKNAVNEVLTTKGCSCGVASRSKGPKEFWNMIGKAYQASMA